MSFRILLVETDKAAATVADSVLTDAGHRVAWVDSFRRCDPADHRRLPRPDDHGACGSGRSTAFTWSCAAAPAIPTCPQSSSARARDLTDDIGRYGARSLPKPIEPNSLLALVSELLAGRIPHDPTSSRRWPRKRAELPATVMAGSARVVELSYGGVRLELPRPPGPGRTPIDRSSCRPSACPCRQWPAGRSLPKKADPGAAAPKSRPWTPTRPVPGAGSSTR